MRNIYQKTGEKLKGNKNKKGNMKYEKWKETLMKALNCQPLSVSHWRQH